MIMSLLVKIVQIIWDGLLNSAYKRLLLKYSSYYYSMSKPFNIVCVSWRKILDLKTISYMLILPCNCALQCKMVAWLTFTTYTPTQVVLEVVSILRRGKNHFGKKTKQYNIHLCCYLQGLFCVNGWYTIFFLFLYIIFSQDLINLTQKINRHLKVKLNIF